MSDLISGPTKVCVKCGWEKPLSRFGKDSTKADGYRGVCKMCQTDRIKEHRQAQIAKRLAAIDMASLTLLEKISTNPNATQLLEAPHMVTLLEDVMSIWGGSRGLAQHLMSQYLSAKPGSFVRQRILSDLTRLIVKASEQGYVDRPLTVMSDEELEKAKQARVMQALSQVNPDDLQKLLESHANHPES